MGDRVAAMIAIIGSRWGTAAEYVAVNEDWAALIPGNVSYQSAAAIPLTSLTVLQAFDHLETKTELKNNKKKRILIQAGAGGVGTFAIQYSKYVLGMYVACTASGSKAELLRQLGADLVIDYQNERFEDIIQGYDVVLDPMSWLYHDRTIRSSVLAPDGHYLSIMSSDSAFDGKEKLPGISVAYDYLKHKSLNMVRSGMAPKFDVVAVSPNGSQLGKVLKLLEDSKIKVIIDTTFGVDEVEEALAHLEQGHCTGKVLLRV